MIFLFLFLIIKMEEECIEENYKSDHWKHILIVNQTKKLKPFLPKKETKIISQV